MKNLANLRDALVYQLKGLYESERKLLDVLPKLTEKALSGVLKTRLTYYEENVRERIAKLQYLLEALDEKAEGRPNDVIKELVDELKRGLTHASTDEVRDVTIICNIQSISHYKIAGYGAAHAFATELKLTDVSEVLLGILEDERDTDHAFTRIATDGINERAGATIFF